MKVKKVLVDIYLAQNLGDDMFLKYLMMHYPNAEIVLYHPNSSYKYFIDAYPNTKTLPYRFFYKVLSRLKIYNYLQDYNYFASEFDVLLFLGGGIFREESYAKDLLIYRNSIVSAFKKQDKNIFFLGCSFGPYTSESFRLNYTKLFSKCNDVCFRDNYSYQLFSQLSQVRLAPDILWDYPIENKKNNVLTIGYSVIDTLHKKGLEKYRNAYIEATKVSITKAVNTGFEVQLFSFCQSEGDLEIAKLIFNHLPLAIQSKVEIISYSLANFDFVLKTIAGLSMLIAARFHAVLLGLKLTVPTIAINYSNKTQHMLEDINFRGLSLSFDNLEALNSIDYCKYTSSCKIPTQSNLHFYNLDKLLKSND